MPQTRENGRERIPDRARRRKAGEYSLQTGLKSERSAMSSARGFAGLAISQERVRAKSGPTCAGVIGTATGKAPGKTKLAAANLSNGCP